ncbi:MAG TPA: ATP-binding protein [Anaeromyxobacteraceae bacterium]|nr:ATP-binding protein [Anaeromyxobacteraceae bacterium]
MPTGCMIWLAATVVGAVVVGAFASAALSARRRRERLFDDAQHALLASEERLRFALEATSDVVWDWDVVEDSIYHPGWAKAYGFPEARTPRTGHDLGPFMHPEDAPAFGALLGEAMEGKREGFEIEHRALYGSGEWRWTLGRARVVARDAQGRATRIIGTCADVTERRRMLARLQMADRLASVGTLAAGVAHEINNPLAYVLGNVEHALEGLRSLGAALASGSAAEADTARVVAEGIESLAEAAQGAGRVRDIVRDLKVFSRADRDELRPTSVHRVVEGALNVAGPEIRRRARLERDLADVPTVVANESRLAQVLLNLLVNAAQAIPEGRPDEHRVTVSTRVDASGRVAVSVQDTGCGIPTADQQRIFDPFFTTKPVGVGTGLGLAICHGIVTSLGGEIEMESAPGRGSTFRVLLPASGEPERPAEQTAPRPPAPRARLLVVDDEEGFCRAVERMLADDHEIVATRDPFEALRRVEQGEHFDLLLTDVVMPGLSGMELHARIATSAPALAERTLFVTGGATSQVVAEFLARRPDRVIEKPFGAAALREAIAAGLSREPAARPS